MNRGSTFFIIRDKIMISQFVMTYSRHRPKKAPHYHGAVINYDVSPLLLERQVHPNATAGGTEVKGSLAGGAVGTTGVVDFGRFGAHLFVSHTKQRQ